MKTEPAPMKTCGWNSHECRTRDDADEVIHVVHGPTLADGIAAGMEPERAFYMAVAATIYLRHTDAMARAVVLAGGDAYSGSAGGYGYDRAAAALHGAPLVLAGEVVGRLCDHGAPDAMQAHRRGNRALRDAGFFVV